MSIDKSVLQQRQKLPLAAKIAMSQQRIREWYQHFDGNVYVSFSGGKDPTVLVDLVKNTSGIGDVPVVYCDTGLEYPEVRVFGRKNADVILTPKMTFKEVVETYGYPAVSKEQAQYIYEARHGSDKLKDLRINGRNGRFKISNRYMYLLDAPFEINSKCCDVMKKRPFKKYEKETGRKPYIGTMAEESNLRMQKYCRDGCNAFGAKRQMSTPMGFWTEQDVLQYLKEKELDYAKVYGDIVEDENGLLITTGADRTGCMFCMFGVQYEQCPNRFQRMKETHPKQYDFCMNKLGLDDVLTYMKVDH